MTRAELIKQAYAYGAAVALQEAGISPVESEQVAVKLAADTTGMHPALGVILQAEER